MDRRIYLALFEPGEEHESGYTVTFPDLPGAITEGDDFDGCMHHARECLELHLYGMEKDGDEIPHPSAPDKIDVPVGAFLVPVEAWIEMFRNEMANKAIKKTLTIPKWLNDAAEAQQLNFSQLLQFAIKERLGITQTQPVLPPPPHDEISTTLERQLG